MNGLERLKKILPSYLMQGYPRIEIIVFDNVSMDGSREYLKQFPEIKVVKSDRNIGYGTAKNILVQYSIGEYILMVDNDIELVGKDFLSKIYHEYITLDNPAFLSVIIKDFDKDVIDGIGLYYNRTQKKVKIEKIKDKGITIIPGYHGNSVFFKKDIFKDLGGFDEIYPFNIDDYDLSARAWLQGFKNYLTTNLFVIHHGVDTRTNIKSLCWKNQYYLSGFSRMIWKNYTLKNLIIWWPISCGWIFYKSFKISANYSSFCPIYTYFKSFYFFIRDLPATLKLRIQIQHSRVLKDDVFLRIKVENAKNYYIDKAKDH